MSAFEPLRMLTPVRMMAEKLLSNVGTHGHRSAAAWEKTEHACPPRPKNRAVHFHCAWLGLHRRHPPRRFAHPLVGDSGSASHPLRTLASRWIVGSMSDFFLSLLLSVMSASALAWTLAKRRTIARGLWRPSAGRNDAASQYWTEVILMALFTLITLGIVTHFAMD